MFTVILDETAQMDLDKIALEYEDLQEGLGAKFIEEVNFTFRILTLNPQLRPEEHHSLRRIRINRYPYVLIYYIRIKVVEIYHIAHAKSNYKSELLA
jgi:plasmid stabilization system protein ParE